MGRYFIEVAYKGTRYSGFQVQQNANTVQAEIEKALNMVQGNNRPNSEADFSDNAASKILLTGSSRTDAGVHALQNYFHFDWPGTLHPQLLYKMNAILPRDVVVKSILQVRADAHCRFDAVSRLYKFRLHRFKDPFLLDTSVYYPYKINEQVLHEAAAIIKQQTDFTAFSKTNTQVKNFQCCLIDSHWQITEDALIYTIEANRFLRGMVRLIVGTSLKMARGGVTVDDLNDMFRGKRRSTVSAPAHGLFLASVRYPQGYFSAE